MSPPPAAPDPIAPPPTAPKPVSAGLGATAKPLDPIETYRPSGADGPTPGAAPLTETSSKLPPLADYRPRPPAPGKAADTPPAETQRPPADWSQPIGKPAAADPAGTAKSEPVIDWSRAADVVEGGKPEKSKEVGGAGAPAGDTAGVVVTVESSSGRRVTRVLRHANPIRAAKAAGRSTHAWAKRPTGRLLLPIMVGVLLVGAAGTAGAYLVPEALQANPSPSATPGFPLDAAGPSFAPPPSGALPSGPGLEPTLPATVSGARPADSLAGWARDVGTRVGIPVVAVQAYGYAELVVARTAPNCRLSWTTLAAIGKVESAHGSANGSVLNSDGTVQPPIYGLPLDGRGGRQEIRDTDRGTLDGDTQYDRAVGPMQFIPQTWQTSGKDADNNGVADPNDIDDAALSAAFYLCAGGRDLARADMWWEAILSYNAVRPYAQKVFDAANDYGQRSRV